MKDFIVKYIGQNSSKEDGSDIELEEVRDIGDNSWITIIGWIDELSEDKIILKPARGKNGRLKLTNKGWNLYEKLSQTSTPPKQVSQSKPIQTPTVSTEVNMKRLNFSIEGVTKPVAQWKVRELNQAKSITIVGDCGLSEPQEKCYGKWSDKIINWEEFPRK